MRAQVVANLERFRVDLREHYTPLFDQLADGQHPHTLFVTCVDSRITPFKAIPAACGDLSGHAEVDEAARAVIVRQLDNLRQFPLVRDRIEKGELELHAWFYDVGQAELFEWNETTQAFAVLGGHRSSEMPALPAEAPNTTELAT
jgi:carbonic anhydrase